MSLRSIVIQRQQNENFFSGQFQRNSFPIAKNTTSLLPIIPVYSITSSLKLCCKDLSFANLHLYNANCTKKVLQRLIGYTNTIPQNYHKSTGAEERHAALAIIHVCIMYIKCCIGDDCTLLDCIIVMQQPSQKGV